MDDIKRDVNKSKRSKIDNIRNLVQGYLQKRNYATITFQESPKISEQITYSLVETEVSRPNSILYSCYNSDPLVIDQNFTKFLGWTRDLLKIKNIAHDIELLIGPLFCHLYLDIMKGGHPDKAALFFKAHLAAIDKTKCDDFVKDLINLFTNDSDATCMIEQFRQNKYFLQLSAETLDLLRKFIIDNCHVVFLHILQTWFDLQELNEEENETEQIMEESETNGVCSDVKFQRMLDSIQELENEPKQIFVLNVSYTNDAITCAFISRAHGVFAFNQNNIVHLRPIHSYDSIINVADLKEIKLMDHSKRIYAIALVGNNLVTASEDSNMCIYNIANQEIGLVKICTGHLGPIYCIKISSNQAFIASGSGDHTARLWNLSNGHTLRVFVGHTQAVTSIDIHPNCLYVVTGSADRNIRMWGIDNGNPLRLFHGSKGIIYAVTFSPLGDIIASASDEKKIKFWDVQTSKSTHEIKYKGEPITKLVWDNSGKQICAGSIDGLIRVWEVFLKTNNSTDTKNQEPSLCQNVNCKVLALEYAYETFACVTS